MATETFLAMTSAEIANNPGFPSKIGWMACHFSPYSTGLSNLPQWLPEGALLILNDLTPIRGHDQIRIGQQLLDRIETLHCCGLLLDFQRAECAETKALTGHLLQALPCPVVVSECYARDFDCPVFLPPVPPSCPLEEHIRVWTGRDIWLEIGWDGEQIRLTEEGSTFVPLPRFVPPDTGHYNAVLHCHYQTNVAEDVRFTLWRTQEDFAELLDEAEKLGITKTVGLFQELMEKGA